MAGKKTIARKLVVVGDGNCGKTSLLVTYCNECFPSDYVPTIFETYSKFVESSGYRVQLFLWDSSGQQDYDRLRPLSYPETNVVLLCFTLDDSYSLESVVDKWEPEIRHYLPRVPIVLVGNKKDIRDDYSPPQVLPRRYERPVTTSEGKAVASSIHAAAYVECSALRMTGVREVFDAAIKASLQPQRHRQTKRQCRLL
ncbi:ras-like GTP-binding protein Rho1 [Haemaphysalis longicornis]